MHSRTSRKKVEEAMQFYPNFIDVCPNHDFLALHEYEKQFCPKFMVKIKKSKKAITLKLCPISLFLSQIDNDPWNLGIQ